MAGYGGVTVLDGVSVTARPGTITAVLGANGAGKTTLLRTISGLVRPRHGPDPGRRHRPGPAPPEDIARAGVAHVPEGQGVITELTVEENLRLGALTRRGRAGRAAALSDAYRRFPVLAERARRAAATLSGGERQILVIARALMAAPRVLLLDEPSLGLAPRMVAQVMDLVRQLRDDARADRAAGRAERPQRPGHRRSGARAQPRARWSPRTTRPPWRPTSGCGVTTWASRKGGGACRSSWSSPSAASRIGMIYAAIALSLVLIWRGTRILNYSQGGMAMFTTYVALAGHQPHRQLLAGVRGGAGRWAGARRGPGAHGHPADVEQAPLNAVIVTIGLLILLEGVAGIIYGGQYRSFPAAFSVDRAEDRHDRSRASRRNDLFTGAAVLAAALALAAVFRYTAVGLRLRATAFAPAWPGCSGSGSAGC